MALKLNKQLLQNIKTLRALPVRNSHHHVSLAKQCKDLGMHANNLPLATNDFASWYAARQKRFNIGFVAGVVTLFVGVFAPISFGWWDYARAPSWDKVRKDFPGSKFTN